MDAVTGTVSSWNPGANGLVWAMGTNGSDIYLGGAFTAVHGMPYSYLAAIPQDPLSVDLPHAGRAGGRFDVSPNPSFASVALHFVTPELEMGDLGVYDLAGRLVRRLYHGAFRPGERRMTWDGRDSEGRTVSPGIYVVRFQGNSRSFSSRIARLR